MNALPDRHGCRRFRWLYICACVCWLRLWLLVVMDNSDCFIGQTFCAIKFPHFQSIHLAASEGTFRVNHHLLFFSVSHGLLATGDCSQPFRNSVAQAGLAGGSGPVQQGDHKQVQQDSCTTRGSGASAQLLCSCFLPRR